MNLDENWGLVRMLKDILYISLPSLTTYYCGSLVLVLSGIRALKFTKT
jgi:hypothetical protein